MPARCQRRENTFMTSDDRDFEIPFTPVPRDFPGHQMPPSVPPGMRLELSRSRIVSGKEPAFEEWMDILNSRPDELQQGISAERAVFEATFRNVEADGSTWIYHVALMGEESGGLDESLPIDAVHAAYSRSVKEPGWEELEPRFMLTPSHLLESMKRWATTGQE